MARRYLDEIIGDNKPKNEIKGKQWKKVSYGSNKDTRERVYNSFPRLVAVTDSIAKEYNINPSLLRTRMAAEGFIDYIAKDNDSKINSGDTLMTRNEYINDILGNPGKGFKHFGLNDVGTYIEQGKVNPIRENWSSEENKNEFGRNVVSANGTNNYDNIGLMAATLQYYRDQAKKAYPNASNKDLDRYSSIMYNRGFSGGKKYINNGGKGYSLEYKNGGSVRRSLKDGGIYIKPSHRGRFTALKERTGHSATWFKENGTPAQKKMATFALNAAKWNH